jgi:hypothetical protein
MTPATEYAFITAAPFVGTSASASSPKLLALARTLAPTFALNALGYQARAFSLCAGTSIAGEVGDAKALVLADPCDAIAGERAGVFYDLVEVPAVGTPSYDFCLPAEVVLTAASEHVGQGASALFGRPVPVMAEPYHGPRETPRAPHMRRRSRGLDWLARQAGLDMQAWRLRLFWSGEEAETDSVIASYPALLRLGDELPLALHCMAPQGAGLQSLAHALSAFDPEPVQLTVEAWSPPAMAQALAACDLVLLPGTGAALRSRLIGALHAGRLAIAHPSPYYGKLAEFAWLGEDLAEGVRWSLSHAEKVLARLLAGQRHLDEVHAPAMVARAWLQLFMKH